MFPHRATLIVAVLAGFHLTSCASAPSPRGRLQDACEAALRPFDGIVGLYARHLVSGQEVAIRADELFPTASMIKVPILCATFAALERGDLQYHAPLRYTKDRLYPGEDLLGSFEDGAPIDVARLCLLMATTSDNTASLWLQELCGTGLAVNEWLDRHGDQQTRVNSRTPDRRAAQERYGWGQTSPRAMAELLVAIRDRRAVSPAADEEMQRILSRSYWDGEALSQTPPSVQVMSKQGAVSQSRSEVCLVHAPHGDYVFCVITKEQTDTSWEPDNAGWMLIRRVSAALWRYFEPESTWQPSAEAPRYH